MDRNIARVLETDKILGIMERLSERVELRDNNQGAYDIPLKAYGAGLIDTTRGSIGHWLQIEDGVVKHYNIITPTVWNLSPKDSRGSAGVVEKALIDSRINNVKEPVEIGRIVRSYDPCVSCATHLLGSEGDIKIIEVMV
jgi:hydrogenase large subunit